MRRESLALLTGLLLGSAGPSSPVEPTEVGWDFWENGRPRARVELVESQAGWVREGRFLQWSQSGQATLEGWMAAGRESGAWTRYFENGRVKKRVNYRAGELDGPYESFYESGQRASSGTFTAGRPSGPWQAWNADGSVDPQRSGTYIDGQLVKD